LSSKPSQDDLATAFNPVGLRGVRASALD
jgi:hypothetical protein